MIAGRADASDWPQWMGPNRDGKVEGFKAPQTWPKELKKQWSVSVGEGVATPALVGNRLYVFSRQNDQEVIRCLDAASGEEIWKDQYAVGDADGAAARFPMLGPRSSPAVAEGKVVTLGTRGTLSCLDAESGKVLWRKDDFHAWPRFFVSSSPLILDGLCIAQLGGERDGGIGGLRFDFGQGKMEMDRRWAGVWFPRVGFCRGNKGRHCPNRRKNGCRPGQGWRTALGATLFPRPLQCGHSHCGGPTIFYFLLYFWDLLWPRNLNPNEEKLSAESEWSNPDNSVMYNTPVYKDGMLYGLSNLNSLFCINTKTGETAWNV